MSVTREILQKANNVCIEICQEIKNEVEAGKYKSSLDLKYDNPEEQKQKRLSHKTKTAALVQHLELLAEKMDIRNRWVVPHVLAKLGYGEIDHRNYLAMLKLLERGLQLPIYPVYLYGPKEVDHGFLIIGECDTLLNTNKSLSWAHLIIQKQVSETQNKVEFEPFDLSDLAKLESCILLDPILCIVTSPKEIIKTYNKLFNSTQIFFLPKVDTMTPNQIRNVHTHVDNCYRVEIALEKKTRRLNALKATTHYLKGQVFETLQTIDHLEKKLEKASAKQQIDKRVEKRVEKKSTVSLKKEPDVKEYLTQYDTIIQPYLTYKPKIIKSTYKTSPEAKKLEIEMKHYEETLYNWTQKSLAVLISPKQQNDISLKTLLNTFNRQYKRFKENITPDSLTQIHALEKINEEKPSLQEASKRLYEATITYEKYEENMLEEKAQKELQENKIEESTKTWKNHHNNFQTNYKDYQTNIKKLEKLYKEIQHLNTSTQNAQPESLKYTAENKEHPYNLIRKIATLKHPTDENIKTMEEYNKYLNNARTLLNTNINSQTTKLNDLQNERNSENKEEKHTSNPHIQAQLRKQKEKEMKEKLKIPKVQKPKQPKMKEEKKLHAQSQRFFAKKPHLDQKNLNENIREQEEKFLSQQKISEDAKRCKLLSNAFLSKVKGKSIPEEEKEIIVFMLQILLIEFALTRPLGLTPLQRNDLRNHTLYLIFFREDSIEQLIDALEEYNLSIPWDGGNPAYYVEPESKILRELQAQTYDIYNDEKFEKIVKKSHEKTYIELTCLKSKEKIQSSKILDYSAKEFANKKMDLLIDMHFSKTHRGEMLPASFWLNQHRRQENTDYRHRGSRFNSTKR
ncbi:MAG: hypothetical protein JO131_05930 [Gammaproteobacteria bacterium]|nr:hypothetical protein [Gammaproteobacteria bacterium]